MPLCVLGWRQKMEQLHLLLKRIDFPFKWHWIEGLCVSAAHLCMPSIIHHSQQWECFSFYFSPGPHVKHRPHLAPLSDLLKSPLCWQQILPSCCASRGERVVLSSCQHLHNNSVFIDICLTKNPKSSLLIFQVICGKNMSCFMSQATLHRSSGAFTTKAAMPVSCLKI